MNILIRRGRELLIVQPDQCGQTDEVVACTPRAIVAALAGDRDWRMSMVKAGHDPHPDNLIDWLWHAEVIAAGCWLDAVLALIADRAWSEAAYCLLMAGFAAPLQLHFTSQAEYKASQPNLRPGTPYALGGGCYQPTAYADWWAGEKRYADEMYEANQRPALKYAFSLPVRTRRRLATTMRDWPEDEDPSAHREVDRRCKGPDPEPLFCKWWVDHAIGLLES